MDHSFVRERISFDKRLEFVLSNAAYSYVKLDNQVSFDASSLVLTPQVKVATIWIKLALPTLSPMPFTVLVRVRLQPLDQKVS